MVVFRILWAFLTSRWLWTAIGLALVGVLVWLFGPLVAIGTAVPFASPGVRIAIIAGLFIVWLVWLIVAQRRAIRANRLFVAELAMPETRTLDPAAEGVAAVGARFQQVLDELKRRKLGGRRFLREMPWYVIIGPPAGGKTTALRQSGLDFPFDLSDDLQGVGGTRNCDWFFTDDAVLIDTAGRYVLQESDRQIDAAEWLGFLGLLKKHRGRRALNGVLVAMPADVLAEGEAQIRAHGREIRKRLAEIYSRLEIRLPVYLLVTKADLVKGFEASFADLGTAEREQVWGATFAPGERIDAGAVRRELAALVGQLETRIGPRMEAEEDLQTRAEIFRFPAQVASLEAPLALLVETVFGESRYEESAWLRGFYFTSATQEGTPIDRLVGALASSFGLPVVPARGTRRTQPRSYFLRRLLTDVVFGEAGLATLDPKAEARRTWLWRGGAVGAAAVLVLGALAMTLAYLSNRGAVAGQADEFDRLRTALTPVAARQAPLEPLDLDLALEATTEVANARAPLPPLFARAIGPSAVPQIGASQEIAYAQSLRNILEPRMVALLEATMWRQIREPDFLLDALRTYRMMTGLSPMDPDFVAGWWTTELPRFAPVPPFPNEAAQLQQLAAIERMPHDATFIVPDPSLVAAALQSVCSIPLAQRAYETLLSDAAATALHDWVPAAYAGPNGAKIFTRHSGKTLRVGIEGIYTYAGFHDVVLARLQDVATQAESDRAIFAGGCPESADASVGTLAQDMLKLYNDDFIAQWDGFLHDIALAPLGDLATANENLKDLASADSALKRLLTAIVAETDLARPPDDATGEAAPASGVSKYLGKLGKLGKLAKSGAKFVPDATAGTPPDTSGQVVSDHFKPLKGAIAEVGGAPPALDDAVAALAALSSQLQTVAASPDPDAAIQQQGGLATLTGAVANQAAILPAPLDDWVRGIAGDTVGITREAVVTQLNAVWVADVRDWCRTVAGRYPLNISNPSDVSGEDFARVFGPNQLMDIFVNEQLKPFIDTSTRPWRWRADLGLDDKTLAPFEQAARIRAALFGAGSVPMMSFTLEPTDLSPQAARVTLNLDGQNVVYFNSATRPQPMTWPGKDLTGVITLSFEPVDGSPEVLASESGPWALLRVLHESRLQATDDPYLFKLRLSAQGYWADFDLRASSVENIFNLQLLSKFSCPDKF